MCKYICSDNYLTRLISYWNLVAYLCSKMVVKLYAAPVNCAKALNDDRFILSQYLCMTQPLDSYFNSQKWEAVRGVKWCEQQRLGLVIVRHFLDTCGSLLMFTLFLLIRVLSALTIPLMFLQSTLRMWTCFAAVSRENIPTFYTTPGN